jgi:hypothetical protein
MYVLHRKQGNNLEHLKHTFYYVVWLLPFGHTLTVPWVKGDSPATLQSPGNFKSHTQHKNVKTRPNLITVNNSFYVYLRE